ncbi:MAG TPA: M1 family metallopeptidase [Kofleriaceae bacterium]
MNAVRCLALAALAACSVACAGPAPKQDTAPVSGPDPQAPNFRLPSDVRPSSYRLELTLDPSAKQVSGVIAIDVAVAKPVRAIWLHAAAEIAIAGARVAGTDVRVVRKGDFVGLVSERAAGKTTIELTFTAPIDHARSRGIYAEQEAGEAYAYTFFEATDARRAFPCFDEPAFKAPWTLVLNVKKEHVALGNAAIVNERIAGAMKRIELAPTPPLPTYLVAFIVGPFEIIDGGTGGRAKTPIRFAVPKGRGGELRWAREVTPRVVAALEDYFDMTYPFGKLDVAVVPRYWGTMEHPGLVAMGQPLTLIRPEQESRARKQSYANILAHELAHYWFGDYVTMKWWEDTWLNESLGQWMDMVITDTVEPTWRYRDNRVGTAAAAKAADELLSVQAIRRAVTTPEAIEAAFDNSIVYYKGSSVIRMMEAWVGPDKWRDFIRAFMTKHAWGSASANDFFALLADKLGDPAELVMRSFVEQPGVPLVAFEPHCEPTGSRLAIRQTRALSLGQSDPAQPRWHLPVCFRYGDAMKAHDACVLLDTAEATVPLAVCPTWFVPNQDARGYYRSAIEPKLVQLLLDARNSTARNAKATPAEKMMIVSDMRSAVNRGELSIDSVLAMTGMIIYDTDPKVASWALVAASFRADALDENLYQLARGWREKTFGPMARRLRWARLTGDSDERHRLRIEIVPMIARHDARLGADAERLVDRWLRDRTGIADDLVDAALAVAAFRGNATRFDRYLEAAKVAKDRTEQIRLLRPLAQFIDPVLAKRALDLVLATDFDLRDTRGIVLGLLEHRETRDLALDFLDKHIGALLPRMRDDEAAGFLGGIAGAFCDPERRKRAAAIVGNRAMKIGGAEQKVRRGLDKSDQCIAELARQLPDLKAYFEKRP